MFGLGTRVAPPLRFPAISCASLQSPTIWYGLNGLRNPRELRLAAARSDDRQLLAAVGHIMMDWHVLPLCLERVSISLRGPVARASRISCVAAPCPAARGAGESS